MNPLSQTSSKNRQLCAAAALALSAGVGLVAVAPQAAATKPSDPGTLSMAVFGDAPYGVKPGDDAQVAAFPKLVDDINADPDVASVVHVGDIHSGKTYCTEGYDRTVADLFTRFATSLVYTPGDNEWSDCHKPGEGGGSYSAATGITYVTDANGQPVDYASGDPLANLDLVRSIFFAQPGQTLGNGNLQVTSQATAYDPAHPEDATYVENVRWQRKGIQFVTLNIPGGSNNDADPWYSAPVTSRQTDEAAGRTGADLR